MAKFYYCFHYGCVYFRSDFFDLSPKHIMQYLHIEPNNKIVVKH